MKTVLTTLVCAFALSSTATFAADPTEDKKAKPLQIGVFATKESKIQMAVRKGTGDKAVITLRDANKKILHEEVMSKKSEKFDCRFDVSDLKDGEYVLEVQSGGQKIEKHVKLGSTAPKEEISRKIQLN